MVRVLQVMFSEMQHLPSFKNLSLQRSVLLPARDTTIILYAYTCMTSHTLVVVLIFTCMSYDVVIHVTHTHTYMYVCNIYHVMVNNYYVSFSPRTRR